MSDDVDRSYVILVFPVKTLSRETQGWPKRPISGSIFNQL